MAQMLAPFRRRDLVLDQVVDRFAASGTRSSASARHISATPSSVDRPYSARKDFHQARPVLGADRLDQLAGARDNGVAFRLVGRVIGDQALDDTGGFVGAVRLERMASRAERSASFGIRTSGTKQLCSIE